uniref:Putative secreted salivary protein n=1 Tax=Ixodes ricinus TaxID=34613 RepID=A0A090XE68_IXORI
MTPSVTCILLLGTALFFLPATRAQCINVTLPNVLGLGGCLGTTLRTCPDTSEGLIPDLVVILRCVIGILPVGRPNPLSKLFLLQRSGHFRSCAFKTRDLRRHRWNFEPYMPTLWLCSAPLQSIHSGKPGVQRPDSDQPSQRVQHWKLSQQDSPVLRKSTNNLGSHLDRIGSSNRVHLGGCSGSDGA